MLRIMMLGLRGFPDVQGGVETHAQQLCPLLAEKGYAIEVLVRARYQPQTAMKNWNGVRFYPLWSPKSKVLEAIVHTFLGVLYASVRRPDILHIHAIGPALMTPLARFLGLRVVVTHHGPDYERQKWGRVAKLTLRLGERLGMRLAHGRIVISEGIKDAVARKHGRDSVLIPNGVLLPRLSDCQAILDDFALESGRYILLVSRLVPEKRHGDLLEAFRRARLDGWKLVLVGTSDHPDAYARQVLEGAEQVNGVICTGFQTGRALAELYSHAGLFVLPSSHEGMPIALLEALSYGLPVVASDICANLEVGLPSEHYFPLGNIEALSKKLVSFTEKPITPVEREIRRAWVADRYDWRRIADQTSRVYDSVVIG